MGERCVKCGAATGWSELCSPCAAREAVSDERARLRAIAHDAIVLRKKAETDGAAVIAYEFVAHAHLDLLLSAILDEDGKLEPTATRPTP